MEGVLSAFAQFENMQKAERTKAGMRAALQLGRWTFKAPLGYVKTAHAGNLVWDPSCAEVVRTGFALVADGRKPADVLRQMNAAGLKGTGGRPLSLQSFRSMLRNPIYAGRIALRNWDIEQRADFEPLVGESVFRRVQRRLEGRSVEPKSHVTDREDFPLRRFLKCATCQRPVTASWSKGRNERYAYYHCPKCPKVRGRREAVENAFLDHLETIKPEPGYLRLFRAIVLDVWSAEQDRLKELEQRRTQRLRELRQRSDRLEEAFIFEKRSRTRCTRSSVTGFRSSWRSPSWSCRMHASTRSMSRGC
jgi:site-specific DNA recombinase